MRVGMCSNANFALGEEDSAKRLETIANCGFDYLETQLAPLVTLTDKVFQDVVRRLDDLHIPCRVSLLLFPAKTALVGDRVDFPFLKDFAERAVNRACQIGSEIIVFGHGGTRSYKDAVSKEEAYADLLRILGMVGDIAEKHSIKIAIEPLNKKETNMFICYREVITILQEIKRENVGGLCDWYHAWIEKQDPDEMNIMPEKLFHLHIAYPDGRTVPSHQDDMNIYKPFLAAVKKTGYHDKISIAAKIPDLPNYYPLFQEGLMVIKQLLNEYGLE